MLRQALSSSARISNFLQCSTSLCSIFLPLFHTLSLPWLHTIRFLLNMSTAGNPANASPEFNCYSFTHFLHFSQCGKFEGRFSTPSIYVKQFFSSFCSGPNESLSEPVRPLTNMAFKRKLQPNGHISGLFCCCACCNWHWKNLKDPLHVFRFLFSCKTGRAKWEINYHSFVRHRRDSTMIGKI